MRSNRKLLLAGGVLAAVAASGGAFTNSTTIQESPVVGAGEVAVSGGTVTSINYETSSGNIDSVVVEFAEDFTAQTEFSLTLDETSYAEAAPSTEVGPTTVTFTTTGTKATIKGLKNTSITVNGETEPVVPAG